MEASRWALREAALSSWYRAMRGFGDRKYEWGMIPGRRSIGFGECGVCGNVAYLGHGCGEGDMINVISL